MGVVWCNSLGDSLFQILCDKFCRLCAYCYSHITSHVSQVFASFTHYTSYSLLNIVHVIVCVFRSDQPSLQILWVLMQNIFGAWEFKGRMFENLNFGKTRFKTCVLEKHFISYSCILFLIFNALRSFFQKPIYFIKKIPFFQNFNWSNLFFVQLKLCLKFWWSLCLFWSIKTVVSINQTLRIRFLKNSNFTCSNHFSKTFSLSLRLGKAPQQICCRSPPNFLQGFSLHKPVCPYYPFFSFIFSFSCIFSCIEGLFSDLAYFGVFDDSNLILWNWSLGFCSRML